MGTGASVQEETEGSHELEERRRQLRTALKVGFNSHVY